MAMRQTTRPQHNKESAAHSDSLPSDVPTASPQGGKNPRQSNVQVALVVDNFPSREKNERSTIKNLLEHTSTLLGELTLLKEHTKHALKAIRTQNSILTKKAKRGYSQPDEPASTATKELVVHHIAHLCYTSVVLGQTLLRWNAWSNSLPFTLLSMTGFLIADSMDHKERAKRVQQELQVKGLKDSLSPITFNPHTIGKFTFTKDEELTTLLRDLQHQQHIVGRNGEKEKSRRLGTLWKNIEKEYSSINSLRHSPRKLIETIKEHRTLQLEPFQKPSLVRSFFSFGMPLVGAHLIAEYCSVPAAQHFGAIEGIFIASLLGSAMTWRFMHKDKTDKLLKVLHSQEQFMKKELDNLERYTENLENLRTVIGHVKAREESTH